MWNFKELFKQVESFSVAFTQRGDEIFVVLVPKAKPGKHLLPIQVSAKEGYVAQAVQRATFGGFPEQKPEQKFEKIEPEKTAKKAKKEDLKPEVPQMDFGF